MAQGRDQIIVDVLGNTKPLEKNIAQAANKALTLNTKGFSQPLGKISGQLGEFEKSLAASNARVIAFGASAGAIFAVQKAFSETIKSVIDIEKALTDVNVILNVSQKSLANFGTRLFDIAKNTGLSFAEVARAATEFSRQGLGVEDTLKRTSDALILTRLSGLDTVSSVEALTAAINSFSTAALSSTEIVNKFAAVDAAFAVSSADLAEAIKRVGSSASDVGVNFDQLIALVTSAQQITSRGGSVIGNSLKTIFTRLQRPKTLDALEEIGVATKDQEGNVLPLIQILNSLSQTYEKLGSTQRSQIAETVGGVFQINVLKAALGDLSKEYSIYSGALRTSSGATDEAQTRNEALNQTLAATINKTVANLQSAATDIGGLALAPAIEKALGGINYVLENFGTKDSEGAGAKIGEGIAKGLGNFLSGPGLLLGVASIIKIFERLTVFTADAFKQLTGLNTQTSEQRGLQTQILTLIGRNPQIIEQINSGNLDTASLHKQILTLIEQETLAMQRQLTVAESLTKTLMSAGVTIAQSGAMKGAPIKTKALGFIPNFSANQEIMGAFAGGYNPGQVKKTFIPNYGQVTYNGAETIKKFPGMSQQAIMPPSDSRAGKNYKENFQAAHGFNPYANDGFVPNFFTTSKKTRKQYDLRTKGIGEGYQVLHGREKEIAEQQGNENLFRDGTEDSGVTLKRVGKEVLILRSKKNIITAQLRTSEKDSAIKAGKKEGKATTRSKSVYIYPDLEGTQGFQSGAKASNGAYYKFPIFPFPGGNKQIPDLLYDNVSTSLVGVAKDYISGITSRPNLVQSDLFENYVRSNLSRSAVEASTGQVFESAIKASINRATTNEIDNMDLDKSEIKAIASRFKGAKGLANFEDGDFKNSLSKGNLESFANKLLYKDNQRKTQKFNGFIPNFSPISKALKTENKMGGKGVLDFEPSVGLYVRDQNTQPNFNAVKRDHPEGLGSAMSNSYAMQKGAASLGFIPNFAVDLSKTKTAQFTETIGMLKGGSTLDTSLANLAKETGTLAKETAVTKDKFGKYRDNLIFASLGLSMVGSFTSQLAGDNKILSNNINDLSGGLSTALTAVQLIPGPFGLAAGAAVGLYSAANFLAKTFRDNGEEIGKNLEKIKEASTSFSNSTSVYSQALQKLTDAYSDSRTPTQTIIKLNEDLAKAAMDIPEKYRLQLLSISNNVKLQEEMNKVQASLVREQRNLEFATAANAKIVEGGILGTPDIFKTLGATKSGANEVFKGFSDQGQVKFLKDVNSEMFKMNQPELIKFLEKAYGLNSDIATVLSKLNVEEFKNLGTALELAAESARKAQEEYKVTDMLRQEQIKTQTILTKETLRAKTALESLNEALINLIDTSIKSQTFKENFSGTRASDARSIATSKAGNLVDYAELFKSPESISNTKGRIDQLNRNEDFIKGAREITSSAKQSILEIGSKTLQDLRAPNQENPQSKAAIQVFQDTLLGISKGNLSATDTGAALNSAISSIFGKSLDKSTEIQTKISDEVRQQNEKLASLNQEQMKSNEIAKSNIQIQQKILQARRDIEAFGGVKGFLDPESLKSTFDSFTKNLNLYRGPGSRSNIERGRGAAGLLSDTMGLVGGGFNPETTGGLGNLRKEAISGRSIELRNQARNLGSQAPAGLKPIFRDIASRSNEIATKQIDNLLKDQNIGQNVDEITQLLKSIEQSQGQTVMPELNNTINSAILAIQQDLTPSIGQLEIALNTASKVFSARETYQSIGQEIGAQTLKKAGGEFQAQQASNEIQKLPPMLQKSIGSLFPRANLYDFTGGNEGIINQEKQAKAKLNAGLESKQPISLQSLGLSGKENTSFGQILDQYNKQINVLQTSNAAIQAADEAMTSLKSRTIDTATALIQLKENVTPIGALVPTAPQTLQGAIDLKIPNNLLEMNVGGQISFGGGTVQIKISEDSDLTSLVTPIVNEMMAQAKNDIQSEFNNRIFKIREEAGLKREASSVAR
jgi:TP901 family phage tail tape measure protein